MTNPKDENAGALAPGQAPFGERTFSWLRLWTTLPTDPKFRVIARSAGEPVGAVVAVYVFLLVDAANSREPGRTFATDEEIACAYDYPEETVARIRAAMQRRVLSGASLIGWDRRQPLREDDSTHRTRAWRAKKYGDVTHGDARERTVTHGDARGEERRGDKSKSTSARSDETAPAPPGPPHTLLPLTGGKEHPLTTGDVAELVILYPAVAVEDQLRAMRGWLLANPTRRKTRGGIMRFVHGWLAKEQNRSRAGAGASNGPPQTESPTSMVVLRADPNQAPPEAPDWDRIEAEAEDEHTRRGARILRAMGTVKS